MQSVFDALVEELEQAIAAAYAASTPAEDAETLAAKFLYGMISLGDELKAVDLDCRMRKSGLKSIRAAVYLEEARKGDKKPSDTYLEAVINSSPLVAEAQNSLDKAEVERNRLDNLLQVCRESHIYFRGISKGRFE